MSSKAYQIPGSAGLPIPFDLHEAGTDKPLILFAHGFKGFKDYGPFSMFGDYFQSRDFNFLRFNFSHNGTSPKSPLDFVDLEAFGRNNFSIELNDLGLVIDWAFSEEGLRHWNGEDLFLMGHSRGGGICILKTREDKRVKKLVTLASINVIGRFWSREQMAKWEKEGVMYVANARTNQQMPMYWQMYEDFYANAHRLNIPEAVKEIDVPFLCVHGTADETVAFGMAEEIADWNPKVKLFKVEGAGHTFGWKHPWESQDLPQPADEILEEVVEFFG